MEKLSPLQIPAIVAGCSLVLEGLLTIHPVAALFQLLPIFVSAFAVYYAWIGGYYFVACAYAIAGLLSILAFASFRLLVNLPAIGIFLIIVLIPHLNEGPQHDLFALMRFPESLIEFSVVMLLVTVLLIQRLEYPKVFLGSLGVLSLSFALTIYVMFENFQMPLMQRLGSLVIGLATLLIGLLWYRVAAARFSGGFERLEDARADIEVRENYKAELKQYLSELEAIRKQERYRPRWLYSACVESGVVGTYEAMVAAGELESEPVGTSRGSLGPRSPVRGDGIKSDPYEILDLRPGASLEEIKEAYSKQIRVYDPQKTAELSPDIQKIVTKMSDAITRAYGALTKT